MKNCSRLGLVGLLGLVMGCARTDARPAPPEPAPRVELGSAHDPRTAYPLTGRVVWAGEIPRPPSILASLPTPTGGYRWVEMPNPFAPQVARPSLGLARAVIELRGVDRARSRSWDLDPVQVLAKDFQLQVLQGQTQAVGIVRRGDTIRIESQDAALHMVRARGVEFWTVPLPRPNQSRTRTLSHVGHVELTSGSGYHWSAADLFVSDHPYLTITDTDGQFRIPAIPHGTYQLTCWVRNWHLTGRERDPETGLVFRDLYATPLVQTRTIRIEGPTEETFTVRASDFATR